MLPALHLRLRASCLTWRLLEPRRAIQPCRHLSTGGRLSLPRWKQKSKLAWLDTKVETNKADDWELLEELFPEEAERRTRLTKAKREREVPRLQLDVPDLTPQPAGPRMEAEPDLDNRDARKYYGWLSDQEKKKGEHTSLLVLRNASKNLTDDDFRRLIPQGKHIEGWNLDRGDILKIIPGRNTSTLEPMGYYFILFKSARSAFTYQTHVTRLHRLSQSHMPTSLTSPITPPPGFEVNGEDLDALLQTYALIPPNTQIQLRQLQPPYTPIVQQIVDNWGYPAIVNRPDRSPVEVVLRLDGPQLAIPHIKSVLYYGAKHRGLPWTGKERAINLFKWEPRRPNISPMSPRRVRQGDEDVEEDSDEDETQLRRRKPLPCYIIGFDTEAEAQTFVRYWHGRPMELKDFVYENNDSAPIAKVEILW